MIIKRIYLFILLFLQYGRILDIELKIPPRPPCYCFVEVCFNSMYWLWLCGRMSFWKFMGCVYINGALVTLCVHVSIWSLETGDIIIFLINLFLFLYSLRMLGMQKMLSGAEMATTLMVVDWGYEHFIKFVHLSFLCVICSSIFLCPFHFFLYNGLLFNLGWACSWWQRTIIFQWSPWWLWWWWQRWRWRWRWQWRWPIWRFPPFRISRWCQIYLIMFLSLAASEYFHLPNFFNFLTSGYVFCYSGCSWTSFFCFLARFKG